MRRPFEWVTGRRQRGRPQTGNFCCSTHEAKARSLRSRAGPAVDNLIAVGSPGWGMTLAGELNAPDTSLYAVRHPDDVIRLIPPLDEVAKSVGVVSPTSVMGHGSDPAFMPGVTRVTSGTDDRLLPIGGDFEAHSSYFGDEGRARLPTMNIAEIVVAGQPVGSGEAEGAR
ncbi:alpha/beta hydrolase [Herbidospora galbida]|nr:alpha/beta hydrolase [Herbidospora galbida]